MLSGQLDCPLEDRKSYCTIWEVDGEPVGHCNVNKIVFGDRAFMHLHLWSSRWRHSGYGVRLVRMSLPFFFGTLELGDLFSEPYANNPAPNRVLEKVGFEFVRAYRTVPGTITFEQDVNLWHLSQAKFSHLMS